MKERGKIFRSEEVLAILDGRKTMFREPVLTYRRPHVPAKPNSGLLIYYDNAAWDKETWQSNKHHGYYEPICKSKYGNTGDRIWVKETWGIHRDFETTTRGIGFVGYRATEDKGCPHTLISKWRSSQSMPRWTSRITLKIVNVKVEKIQNIICHGDEILAEGIEFDPEWTMIGPCEADSGGLIEKISELWNSIYAKRGLGWDVNPWVWCYEFKRLTDG